MINSLLKHIPVTLEGKMVQREEPCRLCKCNTGLLIAKVGYWDIKQANLIKCANCGLIQLDPMLTMEETAKGCLAYYIEESLRTSHYQRTRNIIRNFRRGVLFGYSLRKLKLSPINVLEFGPGNGYFSQGLQFVFPQAHISVLDINEEVLRSNKEKHQYTTYLSTPDDYIPELTDQFDLIIARDIIEHVVDIGAVISNVKSYLKEGGLFHFITPNGHEDVWKHYLTYQYKQEASELLINHVNYFDGKGLLDYLLQQEFSALSYYTYKLKSTRKGRGWQVKPKLMAPISQNRGADYYIEEKLPEIQQIDFDKKKILDKWFIREDKKEFAHWLSWYHHAHIIKIDPSINVGHEIYGLFKK